MTLVEKINYALNHPLASKILDYLWEKGAIYPGHEVYVTELERELNANRKHIWWIIAGDKTHRPVLQGLVHHGDRGRRIGVRLTYAGLVLKLTGNVELTAQILSDRKRDQNHENQILAENLPKDAQEILRKAKLYPIHLAYRKLKRVFKSKNALRIIKALFELNAIGNRNAVSLTKLAQQAGLPRSTVYLFTTKTYPKKDRKAEGNPLPPILKGVVHYSQPRTREGRYYLYPWWERYRQYFENPELVNEEVLWELALNYHLGKFLGGKLQQISKNASLIARVLLSEKPQWAIPSFRFLGKNEIIGLCNSEVDDDVPAHEPTSGDEIYSHKLSCSILKSAAQKLADPNTYINKAMNEISAKSNSCELEAPLPEEVLRKLFDLVVRCRTNFVVGVKRQNGRSQKFDLVIAGPSDAEWLWKKVEGDWVANEEIVNWGWRAKILRADWLWKEGRCYRCLRKVGQDNLELFYTPLDSWIIKNRRIRHLPAGTLVLAYNRRWVCEDCMRLLKAELISIADEVMHKRWGDITERQ